MEENTSVIAGRNPVLEAIKRISYKQNISKQWRKRRLYIKNPIRG